MARYNQSDLGIRHTLLRLSRVHFFYVLTYMLAIVIFDSWNLLAHEAVAQRWTLAAIFLVINTIIWYMCRLRLKNQTIYKVLLLVLLVTDIAFAAINVYWQRGMASKSVMLFAVPIVSAGLVRSRGLVLAVASIAASMYSLASVRYFFDNYGQGFRVELYGEVFFYSAMMFVLAFLVMIAFQPAKD